MSCPSKGGDQRAVVAALDLLVADQVQAVQPLQM